MTLQLFNAFFEKPNVVNNNALESFSAEQFVLLLNEGLCEASYLKSKNIIIICKDDTSLEYLKDNIQEHPDFKILTFPGLGADPYSSAICSEISLYKRWETAINLAEKPYNNIVICSIDSLPLILPPKEELRKLSLRIKKDEIYDRAEIAKQLVEFGYANVSLCEGPGSFSLRGEILDVFSVSNNLYRISFFDEIVEDIHIVDPATMRKSATESINEITLFVSPTYFISPKFSSILRENIPQVQPVFKKRYDERVHLFDRVGSSTVFENFSKFFGTFIQNKRNILDYFDVESSCLFFENKKYLLSQFSEFIENIESNFLIKSDDVNVGLLVPPNALLSPLDFSKFKFQFSFSNVTTPTSFFTPFKEMIFPFFSNEKSSKEAFNDLLSSREYEINSITFTAHNQHALDEFVHLFDSDLLLDYTIFKKLSHDFQGFHSTLDQHLFLSDSDFSRNKFRRSKHVSKSKKFSDMFSDQLSNLIKGDFVIHRDHGVGIYQGLNNLTFGSSKGDFVEILYKGNDKVYVPVYKLHLIQKYSDAETQCEVADLNTKKFEQAKERATNSIKKLAFDLLKLQAERTLKKGFSFSAPNDDYHEFELSFPYDETDDQLKAIEETLFDMQSDRPMDRLICGDVGYGKTEVAIRAAFKAVLDHKQVVVLVPTTILAIQHFYTFKERLKDFPINIEHFSRLKNAKDSNQIFSALEEGKIDIIIGTHRVLSDQIKFKDLGLVIIDEEHRFGVAHKEKLKLLRTNIDFLTLSATPIPRTLQLSFLGIKDMSLIKTPPARRQSVKTIVLREDIPTLQQALEFELKRGGQIYIVHNRVVDLDDYAGKIKKLVPSAKIITAHGQLNEKVLEKRILSFFNKEYDILVSTTIIESGVDIPNANTLIVDRADCFGLAQLHQLRGRIGRSDRKAYAYFVIPNNYEVNPEATRRLQALENFAELGAGFNLANVDLEIRGAGDILGPEQSGNMKSIGFESYMYLLEEAIHELKGETTFSSQKTEIQSYLSALIPESFIHNESLRLKYYKRLSNSHDEQIILDTLGELEDLFGNIPSELSNLGFILRSRVYLSSLGVNLCRHVNNEIILSFDENFLSTNKEFSNKLINYFLSFPKKYKFKSTYTVSFQSSSGLNCQSLYEYSKHIAQQIGAC